MIVQMVTVVVILLREETQNKYKVVQTSIFQLAIFEVLDSLDSHLTLFIYSSK